MKFNILINSMLVAIDILPETFILNKLLIVSYKHTKSDKLINAIPEPIYYQKITFTIQFS